MRAQPYLPSFLPCSQYQTCTSRTPTLGCRYYQHVRGEGGDNDYASVGVWVLFICLLCNHFGKNGSLAVYESISLASSCRMPGRSES